MGLLPRAATAQAIRLDARDTPVQVALLQLREQAGVDIVFSERLVGPHYCTCLYQGDDVRAALDCVLKGTGLQAESVRRRQFVVVSTPRQEIPSPTPVAAPRASLSGFVADSESGELLPGAHVYLTDFRIGTTTNDAGYFAIASLPMGEYRVTISYLGFHRLDMLLTTGTTAPLLKLRPLVVQADSVVVEADRDARPDLSSVPGMVNLPVGRLSTIPSFPGEQDLFQALRWLPGVQRSGEVNGGLLIRGGEPDQNLFLVDGAPIYHPWHAFSLVSTFQTETFKNVRLYRGSFPAEHGGRLAAVLDAQLKDGSRKEPSVSAGLSVLAGRIMIESPLTSKSSFMISGRRSYLDQIIGRHHPVEDDDGRRDTLRTGYYFYDFSAKYSYELNRSNRLSATYYGGRDNLDLRLPFDLSFDSANWLRPADLFFEVAQDWGNRLFSLRHQLLFSPRLFLTSTAYYSGYRAFEGARIRPSSSALLDSDYRIRLHDYGLKTDLDYYHGVSHQVRAGVQAVERVFHSQLDASVHRSALSVDTLFQDSDLKAWELAAYVQDAWTPGPRWQVLPGLRLTYFSGSGYTRLDPRLSVQYAAIPRKLMIRGAAGTQVQYIHRLRDRYSFMYDLVSSRWIPASSSVRPSTSYQIAVGSEYYVKPWLTLSSDLYYRYSHNVLLPADEYQTKDGLEGPGIDVGTLLGQYTPAESRVYGIELAATIDKGPWQVLASYTGGRLENRAPKLEEHRFRPNRFDVPHMARATVTYGIHRWAFSLLAEARSGYPYSMPVARYAVGDPLDEEPVRYLYRPGINNARLPGYWRIDGSLTYRFHLFGGQWQSSLHLYNATNQRNIVSREYDPATPLVAPLERRSLPIVPLVELEVSL